MERGRRDRAFEPPKASVNCDFRSRNVAERSWFGGKWRGLSRDWTEEGLE